MNRWIGHCSDSGRPALSGTRSLLAGRSFLVTFLQHEPRSDGALGEMIGPARDV